MTNSFSMSEQEALADQLSSDNVFHQLGAIIAFEQSKDREIYSLYTELRSEMGDKPIGPDKMRQNLLKRIKNKTGNSNGFKIFERVLTHENDYSNKEKLAREAATVKRQNNYGEEAVEFALKALVGRKTVKDESLNVRSSGSSESLCDGYRNARAAIKNLESYDIEFRDDSSFLGTMKKLMPF